jgi:hypothetical protein
MNREKILMWLVSTLIARLDKDEIKQFTDEMLDKLEDKIVNSETRIDDIVILPVISLFREVFGVPDDYNGDKD